jgi:hypothetical protein
MRFTPQDYRAYVQISHKRHLLVEGRDDKRAFLLLIDEIQLRTGTAYSTNIDIDSANDLIDFGVVLGNRQKVENIAASIAGHTYAPRFVGFVDREFRQFTISNTLEDSSVGPTVIGQLVWSHGHSLENYYFDLRVMRAPLRDFSVISNFHQALALLEKVFDSTLQIACAASLMGRENDLLWLVKRAVDWQTLLISGESISLDLAAWEKRLAKHLNQVDSSRLVQDFEKWLRIVELSNVVVARMICHGHIGFSYLWAAYARCVYEVTQNETEVTRVLRADETVRLNATASSWSRVLSTGARNYPTEVLRLLSITSEY